MDTLVINELLASLPKPDQGQAQSTHHPPEEGWENLNHQSQEGRGAK